MGELTSWMSKALAVSPTRGLPVLKRSIMATIRNTHERCPLRDTKKRPIA